MSISTPVPGGLWRAVGGASTPSAGSTPHPTTAGASSDVPGASTGTLAGWVPVLRFAVGGKPAGASRPRVAAGRAYMPTAHREAEGGLVAAAQVAWVHAVVERRVSIAPVGVIDEPVRLDITLVAARPKRLNRRKDPDDRIPRAVGKPDADNAAKLVMDALVKAMVLRDDTLVCDLHVSRCYAARGEGASTEVVVSVWRGP